MRAIERSRAAVISWRLCCNMLFSKPRPLRKTFFCVAFIDCCTILKIVLLTGAPHSYSEGTNEAFAVKYNLNAAEIWILHFHKPLMLALGLIGEGHFKFSFI